MTERDTSRFITDFTVDADAVARGFVVDASAPRIRHVVEILADGLPVALLRAQDHRDDVELGDGCYGFVAELAPGVLARARRIEARLANTGVLVGAFDVPVHGVAPSPRSNPLGKVENSRDLRLSGWVDAAPTDPAPVVKALLDGVEVARATCRSFARSEHGTAIVRSFRLDLPRRLADGRVRAIDVLTEDGRELSGSPCLVFALEDGFAGAIEARAELESERVRARFADGLLPRCVPFSDFADWARRFPAPAPPRSTKRVLVLVVGATGFDQTLASLEAQIGVAWSAALFPSHGSPAAFEPRHLCELVDEGIDVDLVVAVLGGAEFIPTALGLFVDAAERFPDSMALYGDYVVRSDGVDWPVGLPAFDGELFLEQGYCALCFALRPAELARAAAAGCSSLYALFPDPAGGVGAPERPPHHPSAHPSHHSSVHPLAHSPVHLPAPLARLPTIPPDALAPALREASAHRLAARHEEAEVTIQRGGNAPAVRVRRRVSRPSVSILIAQAGDAGPLTRTLDALAASLPTNTPQVIVARREGWDGEETPAALRQMRERGWEAVTLEGLFSEAHLLNAAAQRASGELLLTLRAGTVPASPDWLDEMAGRCAPADVGAVGGLLAWPDGVVREAGFVLGPRFALAHRFRDRHIEDGGYGGWLAVAHEVSAVSTACLMTPRRWFEAIGGFDEKSASPVFHGAEYGLNLRSRGARVVLTPRARFVSRDADPLPRSETLLAPLEAHELRRLRGRWRLVPGCDPFYSPWMAMDDTPYSGLAWPPVPYEPRRPVWAPPRTAPSSAT